MRSLVFCMAVLAILAGSPALARAEEKKENAVPAAAAPAEELKKESAAPAGTESAGAPDEKKDKAAVPAKAAEAPAKTEPAKDKPALAAARQLNPANPWSKKVNAQAMALAKQLNDEQSQKVAEMMMGFDMLRQIRIVEKDVGKAVEECGKNNPDIKDKIASRFGKWKSAVDPALSQNENSMNAAIKAKVAGDPRKIRDYFDLIEKYGEYEEVTLNKHAVTSAEECERLLSSLDRTQIALTEVLQKIKWPATADGAPVPEKAAD
jgi:hypothetical protein